MKRSIFIVLLVSVLALILVKTFHHEVFFNLKLERLKQEYALKPIPPVDHTQFEILQQAFKTPQDVTEACISCHNQRHIEVMNSPHWNWERVSYVEGVAYRLLVKKVLSTIFASVQMPTSKAVPNAILVWNEQRPI
jgi:hypothetical protein